MLILNVLDGGAGNAHAYGLDHGYCRQRQLAVNHSACNDPMTYRNDCGGEKFFRNENANCGETANRGCVRRHAELALSLSVFGAGTPITGNLRPC